MDPALLSMFVLLQLVLSPLLYPLGYIIQGVVVLASGYMKYSFGEVEYSLLETLFLVWLVCNMVMEENISIAGYATRAGILLLRLCISPRLQQLGRQIVDPITSCFIFMQLVASPHLYPVGYLAQLGLILYLTLSGSLQVVTLWMLSSRKHFQKQFFPHATSAFSFGSSLSSSNQEENLLFASDNMSLRIYDKDNSGTKNNKSSKFSPRKRSVSSNNSSSSTTSSKSPSKRKKISPNSDSKTPPTEAQLLFRGIKWISHQLYCLCVPPKTPPTHNNNSSNNRDTILASQNGEGLENEEMQQKHSLEEEKEVEKVVEEEEEEVEDEEEEEEDPLLCKICFECPATTAFVACGHVCCRQCSDTLLNAARQQSVCPFCQCTISQKIDLFFP